MAHFKRGKCRTTGRKKNYCIRVWRERFPAYCWWRWTPGHWDTVFHERPMRAATKRLETQVMKGADPDELLWPLHKKPQEWYF